MKLRNEFEVGAPLERTWDTLQDVARIARALPGATIEPEAEGGAWRGRMKVKLGPVTTEYTGTARIQDADEDDRVVSYRVEGREVRGQGSAAATITARLAQADGRTQVVVETDMQITGRQAQLGRGLMEDVAGADARPSSPDGWRRSCAASPRRSAPTPRSTSAPRCEGRCSSARDWCSPAVLAGVALGRVVWRR